MRSRCIAPRLIFGNLTISSPWTTLPTVAPNVCNSAARRTVTSTGFVGAPTELLFQDESLFETSTPKYDWINRIIAIGTGGRVPDGPIDSLF